MYSDLNKDALFIKYIAENRLSVNTDTGVVLYAKTGKIASTNKNKSLVVFVYDPAKDVIVDITIQRCVWLAAHGAITNNRLLVVHLNGDHTDNRLANLTLMSVSQSRVLTKHRSMRKFDDKTVEFIRKAFACGDLTTKQLAMQFKVSTTCIYNLLSKRRYADVKTQYDENCITKISRKSQEVKAVNTHIVAKNRFDVIDLASTYIGTDPELLIVLLEKLYSVPLSTVNVVSHSNEVTSDVISGYPIRVLKSKTIKVYGHCANGIEHEIEFVYFLSTLTLV